MAGNVAEMDDLDWLNTRRPLYSTSARVWSWEVVDERFPIEDVSSRVSVDVFMYLNGESRTKYFRSYPSEDEAMAALYAAWEAARPRTFPLVKACECETCRGER